MIKNIKLKNFKSFKKEGQIDIGKINVFVGPNSSGKSSFIQGLLLFKNAIQCVVDKHYKGLDGDYRSLIYEKDIHNKIQYKISFDEERETVAAFEEDEIRESFSDISKDDIIKVKKYYDEANLKDMEVTLKIENDNKLRTDGFEINTFEIVTKGDVKISIFTEDDEYKLKLNGNEVKGLEISNQCNFYFKLNREKLEGLSDELKDDILLSYAILEKLESTLIEFSNKLIYMTSLRTDFLRSENIGKDDKTSRVGSRGQHTLSALMDIDRCCDKDCNVKYKKAKIDYWLDEFDLGDKIEVKEVEKDRY